MLTLCPTLQASLPQYGCCRSPPPEDMHKPCQHYTSLAPAENAHTLLKGHPQPALLCKIAWLAQSPQPLCISYGGRTAAPKPHPATASHSLHQLCVHCEEGQHHLVKNAGQGCLGGSVVKRLPSARVLISGSWNQALHRAPCLAGSLLLPLSLPLLVFPLSFSVK